MVIKLHAMLDRYGIIVTIIKSIYNIHLIYSIDYFVSKIPKNNIIHPIKIRCQFIVCDAIWIHYLDKHTHDLDRKHGWLYHLWIFDSITGSPTLPKQNRIKQKRTNVSCHSILITLYTVRRVFFKLWIIPIPVSMCRLLYSIAKHSLLEYNKGAIE